MQLNKKLASQEMLAGSVFFEAIFMGRERLWNITLYERNTECIREVGKAHSKGKL